MDNTNTQLSNYVIVRHPPTQFSADMEASRALDLMRKPFAEHQISKMCKPTKKDNQPGNCRACGGFHKLPSVQLSYVGHAALTDRLLDADPRWTWEPLALAPDGTPLLDSFGGMWIKLTVAGVTRLGYGDAQGKTGSDAMKERIGDALRNAAMRFGAALELWHKGDLHKDEEEEPSTSGQTQVHTAAPAQVNAAPAKRGRPANPPKPTTVAPPEPVKNPAPPIANDNDVPSNIGDKPSPDERKDFQTRLKAYIAETDVEKVKAFVTKKTNSETTTNLSKREWESILGDLDTAKAAGTLAGLLG